MWHAYVSVCVCVCMYVYVSEGVSERDPVCKGVDLLVAIFRAPYFFVPGLDQDLSYSG